MKAKKEINEMTEKEILRQQLELLAEISKNVTETYGMELPKLTDAMVCIYDRLCDK